MACVPPAAPVQRQCSLTVSLAAPGLRTATPVCAVPLGQLSARMRSVQAAVLQWQDLPVGGSVSSPSDGGVRYTGAVHHGPLGGHTRERGGAPLSK